ncbi:hypothetical protein HDV05_002268 [Chytridiales sp. JEL 0842]|nr:hypothetical protein HDV05_002268 [Chytridiales sp. JEL 0842]
MSAIALPPIQQLVYKQHQQDSAGYKTPSPPIHVPVTWPPSTSILPTVPPPALPDPAVAEIPSSQAKTSPGSSAITPSPSSTVLVHSKPGLAAKLYSVYAKLEPKSAQRQGRTRDATQSQQPQAHSMQHGHQTAPTQYVPQPPPTFTRAGASGVAVYSYGSRPQHPAFVAKKGRYEPYKPERPVVYASMNSSCSDIARTSSASTPPPTQHYAVSAYPHHHTQRTSYPIPLHNTHYMYPHTPPVAESYPTAVPIMAYTTAPQYATVAPGSYSTYPLQAHPAYHYQAPCFDNRHHAPSPQSRPATVSSESIGYSSPTSSNSSHSAFPHVLQTSPPASQHEAGGRSKPKPPGARPYSCPLDGCASMFSRRYNLIKHFKLHAIKLGASYDKLERATKELNGSPPGVVPVIATNKGLGIA